MRTTLKRGAGRPQTNGGPPRRPGSRALLSPPSGPLGPMTRYAVWRKSNGRLLGKIALWTVVVLLVAAGALGGGVWLYLNHAVVAIQARSADVKKVEKDNILAVPVPGKPTTALLLGYDKRVGIQGDPGRSDTLMLLRADPQNDTLSLLSFPRDLRVPIAACNGHPSTVDRINAAYAYCGTEGAVKTVLALTRIPINYVIVVNFHAFKQIVDKVGGVYIDVDRRYFNDNANGENYATINIQPGYQRLTGGAALAYARFRHTDSDLHRIARQQQFVKAFKQQVQATFSIFKIPGIINAITKNVEVASNARRKPNFDTLVGYARFLYGLKSGQFYQSKIAVTGTNELDPASSSAIPNAVRSFLNPDRQAAARATVAASGKKPKRTRSQAPPPAQITIEVLNGNGVDASASQAAAALDARGYKAQPNGNAASKYRSEADAHSTDFRYFTSVVVYDPAKAGAKAAAQEVANLFGDADVVAAPPAVAFAPLLRVIVGQTFKGTLAPAPVDTTPKHEPAAVERGFTTVLPLLRKVRGRVDFPILVPTMFASGTTLDSEVPVRAYTVDGHDALKIVYFKGYGSYWGVEETSWRDAPILSGENLTRRIGGRTYQLYYDGTKLHMVAFEENGAVYWVTNTLLDDLSNETMIAIAKGLQPLSAVK